MENNSAKTIFGDMAIEYFPDNGSIIKVIDPIDRSEEFKKNAWVPYFTTIYKVQILAESAY